MQKELIYGLIGLVLGGLITWGVMNPQNNATNTNTETISLDSKSGDDFDKAFITQMIEHHQGAILMAGQAKQKAKHDEIKKMADDIIATQSTEINQMKGWYKNWYGEELKIEDVNSHAPTSH